MSTGAGKVLSILFMGASFGVVLGMRIAAAGHRVTFACREDEADLINRGKLFLRLPAKEPGINLEIGPDQCLFAPGACLPGDADPRSYDLVCLAMAEPHYSAPGVRDLVARIEAAGTPCLSIMNMPLPPFIKKFTTLDNESAEAIFTEPKLWAQFDPDAFSMASSDPQAMRVDTDDAVIVDVTLPTNFKAGPFGDARHQDILKQLATDIDASRVETEEGVFQPRVRLRQHPSISVPLVKWPMLITGNFRCLTGGAPVSIAEAVCGNESESRDLYDWVLKLCRVLGVDEAMLVPFDRYLAAVKGLTLPSSLARSLYAGATEAERVDKLIQTLAGRNGMSHPSLDGIVEDLSAKLEQNHSLLC